MILHIIHIIIIVIFGIFILYWVGRILAKGFFDEIEQKLMQKFNNKLKNKEDDKVQE